MSDQSQKPSSSPIRQAIKKSQTQEAARLFDARRATQITTATAPEPVKSALSPTRQAAIEPLPSPAQSNSSSLTTKIKEWVGSAADWTPRQRLTVILASGLIGFICLASVVFALGQTSSAAILYAPLPTVSASSVLDHFRTVGLIASHVQRLNVPDKSWKAVQGIQAELDSGSIKGNVLILSYKSRDEADADAFRASIGSVFGNWTVVQAANILLLTSPDTPQTLNAELSSHLTQQIIAPYRAFLATSTPNH